MHTTILSPKFMVLVGFFAIVLVSGVFFIKNRGDEPLPPQKEPLLIASSTTEVLKEVTPTQDVTNAATSTSAFAFKSAMTTIFWVGEGATPDNDYISNSPSYWDEEWQSHYGGIDDLENRCGYVPCTFSPRENPFYVALPYAEYDSAENLKSNAASIPWYDLAKKDGTSLLKNRWVEVRYGSKTCFGQWEDVGPNGEDDFAYVFGTAQKPINTFGEKAGLDISPAMMKCLGMTDNATTQWRFIDIADVPEGPWRTTITHSGINWR